MTNLVELFTNLHPIAKFALGAVVSLQGAALLAWSCWLIRELNEAKVSSARDKKNR